MIYDKEKLLEIIDDLNIIKEFDYIIFTSEDNEKVNLILNIIEEQVKELRQLQENNYYR